MGVPPAGKAGWNMPASMTAFWAGNAHFEYVAKGRFYGPDGSFGANVGFHIVPSPSGVWYLFHREYNFGVRPAYCTGPDYARIVLRNSSDEGRTWSDPPVVVAEPTPGWPSECALVDGAAFYEQTNQKSDLFADLLSPILLQVPCS